MKSKSLFLMSLLFLSFVAAASSESIAIDIDTARMDTYRSITKEKDCIVIVRRSDHEIVGYSCTLVGKLLGIERYQDLE